MTEPAVEQSPETAAPEAPAEQTAKRTLEETLAALDEDGQKFVTGEIHSLRKENQGLRGRIKVAEPKAQQLDKLMAEQQTDDQRKQQEAEATNRRATEIMHKAARTTVKHALAGVVDDPESVLDDLNIAKFVTDDGEIDEDAVTALRERFAALGGGKPRIPAPNPAQGTAGSPALQPRDQFAALIRGATR